MKMKAHIIAAAILVGVASAQTAPASQSVKQSAPQPKTSAQKSPFAPATGKAQTSTKVQPVSPKTAAQTAPKQTAQAQAQHANTATPKPIKKSAAPEPKADNKTTTAVAENAPAKLPSPGKRDPFLSPIAAAALKTPGANCTTGGKHCLVVDQVVLKGIVQMKSGSFAVVENASKKQYFLRENDALFNGSVVKINGDSVIFKEDSSDILGRPVSKEVVKKVSAPAV